MAGTAPTELSLPERVMTCRSVAVFGYAGGWAFAITVNSDNRPDDAM